MEQSFLLENYFFFFQAEDGIRDYKVTGVQTCALPISIIRKQSGDGSYCLITWPSRLRTSPQPPFSRLRSPDSVCPNGYLAAAFPSTSMRSEERRVGKECRFRCVP